jgi:hypothetical protein
MTNIDELISTWRSTRLPQGSPIEEVNELCLDVTLANEWIMSTAVPFIEEGKVPADVIGVTDRLADLNARLTEYHPASESESVSITSYLQYLDLLRRLDAALEHERHRS